MTLVEYLEGELRRYFPYALMLSVELLEEGERIEASIGLPNNRLTPATPNMLTLCMDIGSDDDWYVLRDEMGNGIMITIPLAPEGSING